MPISSELQDRPAPWEPSQEDVDRKAWKYAGYRSFCEFVSSDEDFFVLRRFGTLSARVLLHLQDQLAQLEEKLEATEQQLRQKNAPDVHNGSFRQDTRVQRKEIISEAQHVLREYSKRPNVCNIAVILQFTFVSVFWTKTRVDNLVLQHSQLRARPKVPRKDIISLENWLYNHPNAILPAETEYIKRPSDLFTLVPASKSPLRLLLERSSHFRLLKLWRQKPSDSTMVRDENVHYISDARIDHFVTVFIISIGLIMLIAPLWILTYLGGLARRLAVISAFIVLFVIVISWTTVAKPFESLAAAAA